MAEEERDNGSDVNVKVAGQEISLRNVKSLNTIATMFTLFGMLMLLYIVYAHQQESREGAKEFVMAIKEQTKAIREGTGAQREQTCMLKFEQSERRDNADWCKQVSGAR